MPTNGASARARGRVLIVAPQPFYEDRGTPIAVRQVAEALSQLGRSVDLLTFPVGRTPEIPQVRIIRAANPLGIRSVPVGLSARKLVLDATLVARLAAALARRRYGAIHAVEEAIFPALVLGPARGVPVIYDMQSSLAEQLAGHPVLGRPGMHEMVRGLERWAVRHADRVVASTGLAARVRRLIPEAEVREWRYPSAVVEVHDDDRAALRRALGLGTDTPVVLYSGTFEAYQGLDALVTAIPLVRRRVPSAVFVLVGAQQGDDLRRAAGTAGALIREGALRVVERRPREEIPRYLAAADVLVSPRVYGGNLPLKIFDYLAAGRPIVASDIPTHRTVLDERYAVLVEPTAPALATAIADLLEDRPRAERLGAAARTYAAQQFGWSRFLQSVGELYDEVLACAGSR